VKIKIWSDLTGRITRVRLADSTGDVAVDEAIRTDALLGHQLPDIPEGMRMPIELRLNLRRPN
jgi:outer membrane biosynthesis protein TonB